MQACRAVCVPLRRHVLTLQPQRTFFFRRPRFPVPWTSNVTDLDLHFRDMARQFEQLEREVNSAWAQRRSILPTVFSDRTRPMTMYESELDGKYQMNVYMGHGFAPENIKVSLKDRVLTVEAKYDHTSEDGHSRVYQELTQKFTLPDHIDPLQVKSQLSAEGILQVEAPLPPEPEAAKAKEIPVSIQK